MFYRRLRWAALAITALSLLWLLAPIWSFVSPLGWLGDPLVDRLERRVTGTTTRVILVFRRDEHDPCCWR